MMNSITYSLFLQKMKGKTKRIIKKYLEQKYIVNIDYLIKSINKFLI